MKSLFKIAQATGYVRNGTTTPDAVSYSVIKSSEKHHACVFTLGAKVRHDMRWMIGDRVDVLYDPSMAEGQLVRCKEGGWAITGRSADAPVRIRLNLRPEFCLPMVEARIDLTYETTNSTICFAFPTIYRVNPSV